MAKINRPEDVATLMPDSDSERLSYSPINEDALIARIFQRNANYRNDLKYCLLPTPTDNNYNSNSYLAGLLRAVGLPPPTFPGNPRPPSYHIFPGWGKPVPQDKFQPQP